MTAPRDRPAEKFIEFLQIKSFYEMEPLLLKQRWCISMRWGISLGAVKGMILRRNLWKHIMGIRKAALINGHLPLFRVFHHRLLDPRVLYLNIYIIQKKLNCKLSELHCPGSELVQTMAKIKSLAVILRLELYIIMTQWPRSRAWSRDCISDQRRWTWS